MHEWKFVTDNKELLDLRDMVAYWEICDIDNPEVLLSFGYKSLPDKVKNLYRTLKMLSTGNIKKYGKPICNPSLEYLSALFGTTIKTQRKYICMLKHAKLLTTLKSGVYLMIDPIIESTFVDTANTLIKRKQLRWRVHMLKNGNNPTERLEHMLEIQKLKNEGTAYVNTDISNNIITVDDIINNYIKMQLKVK